MQKVRQNNLKFSENQFFVFEILIYFFVNVSSNFVIQERLDPLSNRRFEKELIKVPSNDRKVVEKAKL